MGKSGVKHGGHVDHAGVWLNKQRALACSTLINSVAAMAVSYWGSRSERRKMYGSSVVKIITFLPGAWHVRNARKINTCLKANVREFLATLE